ncbi:hypothetical protein Q9R08_10060 [Microbacterium sp. QXD-8]|uniref:Uncharacterized protein n=1 Tax=Microbacterium psychrotolerans TaxID=3068321 RepID=A0ABU0Z165_9MICO|nr:hypothetical protein [Microbacterium sp. QXD-8]MDQ7878316.1 hypothetical protein [Microbacterium sp. QXD-8]
MAAASTSAVRAELADALTASRAAREQAERELHRSVALRARAGEALERTARRPGLDETERARLRAEYAAADRVVAQRRTALDEAKKFEHAASVIAGAYEAEAASASPLAAALLQLVGPQRGGTARRGARASSARTAPAARVRSPRARTA